MEEYGIHPDGDLVRIFMEKPYQGQDPKDARVWIFGIDANYSTMISTSNFFKYIKEYQHDGILFWDKYGIHHPFLHHDYPKDLDKRGGGVPYHRNFAKLGLGKEYRGELSFVELLNIPVTGKTKWRKFWQLFKDNNSAKHIKYLDSILEEPDIPKKLILLSDKVMVYMDKIRKQNLGFKWLPPYDKKLLVKNGVQKIHTSLPHLVYKTAHFSASQIHDQKLDIKKIIDDMCRAP